MTIQILLIFKVKTTNGYYAFDLLRHEILPIDKVKFKIIDDFFQFSKPQLISKHKNKHGVAIFACPLYRKENIISLKISLQELGKGISNDACYEISNDYMAMVGNRCLKCWATKFCHRCFRNFLDITNSRFITAQDALDKSFQVKEMAKRGFESFLNAISKNSEAFVWSDESGYLPLK